MYKTLVFALLLICIASVQAAPLMTGLNDNQSILLDFAGTWTPTTETLAYGGSHALTSDYAATLTYETYASGFTVYFVYGAGNGDMQICIDGADCVQVSQLGAAALGHVEITGLSTALKEIEIKKALSDSAPMSFDAVYIHQEGSVSLATSPNVLYQDFELEGENYTGAIDLSATSGDFAIVTMLTVIAIASIANFLLSLWNMRHD